MLVLCHPDALNILNLKLNTTKGENYKLYDIWQASKNHLTRIFHMEYNVIDEKAD